MKAGHPREFYRSLPKVDLHRHLEGSLRLSTLLEIGHHYQIELPTVDRLGGLVQIGGQEVFTYENFLSKFDTLRLFYRSPQVIARLAREAVHDAALDNVRYLELRFTPVALGRAGGFPVSDVMDWVIDGIQDCEHDFGIKTRLIASVNRHESPEIAAQVGHEAIKRIDRGIVGFDLAGNEASFSGLPFASLFQDMHHAGLHLTVHAGEWGGACNIKEGIQHLHAERIGHGVRVVEDPATVDLARERGIAFEVCLTSNLHSGVISNMLDHPLPRMAGLGLKTTLNTDDPSISQVTLSDEYFLACESLDLSLDDLRQNLGNAAQVVFLPETERAALAADLLYEFDKVMANRGGPKRSDLPKP